MKKEQKRASASHGILFVALFSCAAFYIAQSPVMENLSLSPLIIGIISGMAYGNTLKKNMPEEWLRELLSPRRKLLRLGNHSLRFSSHVTKYHIRGIFRHSY
jgi:uncharacterized membrane protein YadS